MHYLPLDPETFKIKVDVMAPDFKIFLSFESCILREVACLLFTCLCSINIMFNQAKYPQFLQIFCRTKGWGKLFLEGKFYFIVFHFSLTTRRILKVSKGRLLGFPYLNVKMWHMHSDFCFVGLWIILHFVKNDQAFCLCFS